MSGGGVDEYYGKAPVRDLVAAAVRNLGLDTPTPDDLAPIDHFHSGGVRATEGLAALGGISSRDEVLDVGAGLAGPARWLMAHHDCAVVCVDLTEEFCEAARVLNAATGFDPEITRGDMLNLQFPDETFDVVWAQNAFMNIAQKERLFEELHRVLRPGGRLVFQEVMAGPNGPVEFPVPWADRPEISFLAAPERYREAIEVAGFVIRKWEDKSAWAASLPPPPPGPGRETWLPDFGVKMQNMARNSAEGRTLLWWAVAAKLG